MTRFFNQQVTIPNEIVATKVETMMTIMIKENKNKNKKESPLNGCIWIEPHQKIIAKSRDRKP